ncbi:putative transport protein HsrA [Achromobacter agilis]|uniref:Putative transport protein HsrA n=1 Tax=Achromobacter agilis TaxID=1353888 RepID=A0A446CKC6_9BURK|nr:putative transport protein HsrA [Achromobacter agilis]
MFNVPIGIAGLLAVRRYLPEDALSDVAPFDVLGCGLLSLCMVAFSLGLDLPAGEARMAWSAALFGTSALTVLLYVLHAWRRENPLFQLRLFGEPNFSVGLAGNLVCRIGSSAVPFLLPLLLQLQLGYTPLQSGLMMLPAAIAGTVCAWGRSRCCRPGFFGTWIWQVCARHQARQPASRSRQALRQPATWGRKWKSAPAHGESEALLPGFARDGCQTARQLKSTAGR